MSTFESRLKCRCHSGLNSWSSRRNLTSGTEASNGGDPRFFLTEAKPHYPRDRFVDFEHMRLECHLDIKQKKLNGVCTHRFRILAPKVSELFFDAVDLVVEKVMDAEGKELLVQRSAKGFLVKYPEGSKKVWLQGEVHELKIQYYVQEPRAGMYFIAPDQDYPGRPFQLWTQGEDEDNRYWFPCYDAPQEKFTSEMIVTVDEPFMAISNGRLVSKSADPLTRKVTFHWSQDIAHPSYLVTLCAGEFVEIPYEWTNSKGKTIPVPVYAIPGREAETKFSFYKTSKMMDVFSQKLGVDYPFDKYAQIVAWDFIYGGMENTSSTTQTEYTLHPESVERDYSSEPLVAHELAHQWFGDYVTCKEWKHAWLNEGFATYFETVWMLSEQGLDETLFEFYQNYGIYMDEDSSHYRRPIVTNVYISPSDLFDRHLYEKGGLVLRMLHQLVGDDSWWKALKIYLERHAAGHAETSDLQRAFEEVTGLSLGWFFDQWVFKAGHPELKLGLTHTTGFGGSTVHRVMVKQTQKDAALTPVFKLQLQFKAYCKVQGRLECFDFSFQMEEREQTFSFTLPAKLEFININPGGLLLAEFDCEFDQDHLIAQLHNDPDLIGRIFAAKSLKKDHSLASVKALAKQLAKETFWGVQVEIAKCLADIGSERAWDGLAEALPQMDHPKAKRAVIQALGTFRSDRIVEILEPIFREDQSPLVLQAVGVALGKSRASGIFEKLTAMLGKRQSWHDYADCGIVAGLAELKLDDRVLPVLLRYTKAGKSMFLRRTSVDALAYYASARPGLVVDALTELTRDTNFFVRLFAIEALARLADPRALASLDRVAKSVVEPRTKRAAIEAMKSVREGESTPEAFEKLKVDFDFLRESYAKLLSRVEKMEGVIPHLTHEHKPPESVL